MEILDQERHRRLLTDSDGVCRTANIQKAMLSRSATSFCTQDELDWVISFPEKVSESRGLMLVGSHNPGPEVKMAALTAVLLRNFIDARLVPLNTLLGLLDGNEDFSPTAVLIPNLFVRGGGKTLPSWKMQQVYDFLLRRSVTGKASVVYVEDLESMQRDFGLVLVQHLLSNYDISRG